LKESTTPAYMLGKHAGHAADRKDVRPMNIGSGLDKDNEVTVRLPADLARALDRFIEGRDGRETRAHAAVAALREWAHERGYLSEPGDEGLRPEDLSSANDG
jgi:hypothetical protein